MEENKEFQFVRLVRDGKIFCRVVTKVEIW